MKYCPADNSYLWQIRLHSLETLTVSRFRQFGIDLTQPRAVILIDASEYLLKNLHADRPTPNVIPHRIQTVINSIVSFFHLPNDTICADLGEGKVGVLKASNTKNLDSWATRTDITSKLYERQHPQWVILCER